MEILPILSTFILVATVATGLYVASLVWVYRDARRREVSPLLVVVLVALAAWPLGLLAWIALRPVSRG